MKVNTMTTEKKRDENEEKQKLKKKDKFIMRTTFHQQCYI